jgi:hypothetical protein
MYCLNDKQIDFILNDIRARGVEMEDLQYNLLDHVCCIIEQNLEETGDFEHFYQTSIKRFYKKELWEIEEETISLIIFKHFYTMKKIMLYSGIVSAFLVAVGILFKFMHWPGAGMTLVLGISMSSLIFLPLMFVLKIREKQNTRDKLIIGLGALAGSALSMGILFKIMHWPGANVLGMSSILVMVFIFLPIYFFTGIRNPETKVNTIVSSALIVIGCGLFMALVRAPKGTQLIKVRETYAYLRDQEILQKERTLFNTLKQDSVKSQTYTQTESLDLLCEEIKADVLELSSGVRRIEANFEANDQYIDDGSYAYNPFDYIRSGQQKYVKLVSEIEKYNQAIAEQSVSCVKLPTSTNFIEYLKRSQFGMITSSGLLDQLTQIQMLAMQNALITAK